MIKDKLKEYAKLGRKNLEFLYNYDLETGKMKTKDDPTYVNLDDYNYDLLKNTPLIIYSKDDKVNKEISSTMGMWDVYPTIANMFNLNYRYPLGNTTIFSFLLNIINLAANIYTKNPEKKRKTANPTFFALKATFFGLKEI